VSLRNPYPVETPVRAGTLDRTLGGTGAVMLTLSALSPTASVFVTGATILHLAGTGTALAVMIGGGVILLASLLAAELAAAFPSAGGLYPGIAAVLGRGAGFAVATLGLVTIPALLAFLAIGFANYAHVLLPWLPVVPAALGALAVATLMAMIRIRIDAWITGAVLVVELLALILLAGVAAATPARGLGAVIAHPVMLSQGRLIPTPPWTMMLAMVSAAFACSGATGLAFFAEDLTGTPQRVGRLLTIAALISLVAICGPLILVTTGAADLADILAADAPIARYLQVATGPTIAAAATAAVVVAVLNNVVASLIATSRLFYATARDGIWPAPIASRLGAVHPRSGAPWMAALVLGIAASGFALVDPRRLLILLSGEVFTGLLLVVAVVVGRLRGLTGVTTYRSPLFPLTAVAGLVAVAAFVTADWHDPAAGRPSIVLLGTIALAAFLFDRFVRGRRAARG
jgi:amino acid transporter